MAKNDEWAIALREKRVVQFEDGHLTSYPTHEARDRAMAEYRRGGGICEIVHLPRDEDRPWSGYEPA